MPQRHVPLPTGPLTGRRTPLRRVAAQACAALNQALDLLPLGRWLHRRIRRGLQLSELELRLRRPAPGLDGLRIAFVSDVHAGSFMDAGDLHAIFESVAAANPDLVLFGGDLINTRERELLHYREPLRLLRPALGMFAVPGNHDLFWGRDLGLWSAFLEDQGVTVLCNRGVRIARGGTSLWLCGVDDLTEGSPDLRLALDGRRDGEATVLLSHHPDFFFEAAAADVDLTLSGHTHGGQIRLFGRAPIHHSRFGYEQGWFQEADCSLYVGRGVGVTLLPIRIDARPEVPIVTVRCPVATGDERTGTAAREAGVGSGLAT
ncbi:MAG: metallophosphoesterase [Planctomycetes bacterium]|nr:metallophosphoesterase [Planctomycetota bacterium]MCB9884171.1 metallophosphoesterase [Planctomycetota bacterium]